MVDNPLISIIIPAYNAEKYIEECVNSTISQTYKNIEIIVVNDGSTDQTADIISALAKKDNRIKLFNKTNGGVSSARNYGIEKSRGEYIFFIDSDDFIDPNCVEYYYSLVKKFNAEISIVPMPKKIKTGENNVATTENLPEKVISGKQAFLDMLYYKIVISSWGKMFSRKLIEENHIRFNEKLAYGEGFSFSLECFQAAKKVTIGSKQVYNYRLDNSNSVMTRYKRKLITDSLEAQKYIQSFTKYQTDDVKNALAYVYWHTCCDCLNTIIGSKTKQDKDLKYQLIKDIRKGSLKNLPKPIPKADKIKSVLFFLSPTLTSKLINLFRKRKFTKV